VTLAGHALERLQTRLHLPLSAANNAGEAAAAGGTAAWGTGKGPDAGVAGFAAPVTPAASPLTVGDEAIGDAYEGDGGTG
jgi:hypothetical protein